MPLKMCDCLLTEWCRFDKIRAFLKGKSGEAKNLRKAFGVEYGRFLDMPYVLHPRDLKVEDGVTYLPLYMAPLLVTYR